MRHYQKISFPLQIFICMLLIFLAMGCEREHLDISTPEQDNHLSALDPQITGETQIESGILKFASSEDYTNTINHLARLSQADRIKWGDERDFYSLQMVYDQVSMDEDLFDALYFEGLDPDLTLAQLASLGKPIQFSQTYRTALQQGYIVQTEDLQNGGLGFELAIGNKAAAMVVNRQGLVIVGDILIQHTPTKVKQMNYQGPEDIALIRGTGLSTEAVEVIERSAQKTNSSSNSFINGNIWTQSGVVWYYESSNYRFKHYVSFQSSTCFDASLLSSIFYTEAVAERKRFGKWRIRNSYNPIQSISGFWDYHCEYFNTGGFEVFTLNTLPAGINSPLNLFVGSSNHVLVALNPTGNYTISSPFAWFSEVIIDNYSIKGTFNGISGYYETPYHN